MASESGFAPLRLHSSNGEGWAVISLSNGAITTDSANRLLMRFTEAQARRIAAEMTEEAIRQFKPPEEGDAV